MATKRGLGRGFDSLIPTQMLDVSLDPTAEEDAQNSNYKHIAVEKIIPDPEQPRRHFDEAALHELAGSIKEHGILLPLVVSPEDDKFHLVAGERRWRAAQIAGLKKLPAIVRSVSAQHKLELSLIENLQRRDLNPLETATAYVKLMQQFNLTYEKLSERVGVNFSTISNVVRLLNLPEEAKNALLKEEITQGHARQILAIEKPQVQKQLLDLIIKNGWSVRKAEQFVTGYKADGRKAAKAETRTRSETRETKQLAKHLAAPVKVKTMANGGQLIITYKSDEDLKRIYQQLI